MISLNFFQLIGALGAILISIGVLLRERKVEDILYLIGGICLEIYSLHLGDLIFIVLQLVFIFATVFDLCRLRKKGRK